jgi:hypothetical protein
VEPKEEESTAVIKFGPGHEDMDIFVAMMYRACYPEIKINR